MSYPGGFSRLRIVDEGTKRMAKGENNVESHVDEDFPSTSIEEVLSRADATGVITWLTPVEESGAYAF